MAIAWLRRIFGTVVKLALGIGVVGIALLALAAHTALARVTPQNLEPRLSLLCNAMMMVHGLGRTSRSVCDCMIKAGLDEFGREGGAAVADLVVLRLRENIADGLAGRLINETSPVSDETLERLKKVEAQWYLSCRPDARAG